ncbi:extracellular solute-binding protein [Enterococcus alcedinis]|uniref:Sugar ABC transporter substrate-binding protein n=1 Tax=Enterococcus alcedinis TaxID=1274384 RepID=A0A917JHE2_9ENTE|nr:sugar ABC transporter substrate-binding protein [Enterococcus alcedinis]MBP2101760.1 multiple sugar transport system substrate-binding protein [Enterococcus alcedinis]GGI65324.1 sugar ABC transporter substrate-binding protein [Enterococcus alcedinis]
MKKKFVSTLGLLGLSTILLAACGGGGTDGSDAGGKTQGDKVVTYALWDKSYAAAIEDVADKFKEETGIEVKLEITPWAQYWTKLETAVTGKNAADVFNVNIPRAIDYIENGVLEPLDGINVELDKIPEQYLQSYTGSDGKLYGIPKDFDTNALFYNKTMFDEAGIAYPDESWTWETWSDVAKQLTNEAEGIYGMAVAPTWQGGYYETIYQNGGSPFIDDGKKSGFDTPEAIEGIEFWHSFVEDGSGTPIELITNTNSNELLLSGKVAMAVDGSYQVPILFEEEFGIQNIDVAPLPKGKERATTSNSLANVVFSGSKNKEAAKQWIEFLSSEESMKTVAEAGGIIPVLEGTQDAWVNAHPDKNIQVFIDAVEYAVPLPGYKNSSAAIAIEQDLINQAWTGELTVEEASKQIAEKANALLAK